MGEQSVPPNQNGLSEEHVIDDVEMNSEDDDTGEGDDDMTIEEFELLDSQLDALNSALDDIEQKNDSIHAQLLQLLNANREIRQQLQESNLTPNSNVNSPKK